MGRVGVVRRSANGAQVPTVVDSASETRAFGLFIAR
jgi:hypothetical protein